MLFFSAYKRNISSKMNTGLRTVVNDLLREAEDYGLSEYMYKKIVYFEDWLYYISVEQCKFSDHNICKSDFSEMISEFINFFAQNDEVFKDEGEIGLRQYCDLLESYGDNELFVEHILDRFRIKSYMDFIECLLNSFRLAVLDVTFPQFLHELKEKAITQDIFNPNILVNIKYWLGCISWSRFHVEDKMFSEIAKMLRTLSITSKNFGSMISLPALYKYLEGANRKIFTPWTEYSRTNGIDLLLKTFVSAAGEVEWPDIVFERMNNSELQNLDLETWATTHLKLTHAHISDLRMQQRIDALKKYYHEKFVYMVGDGFGMSLENQSHSSTA